MNTSECLKTSSCTAKTTSADMAVKCETCAKSAPKSPKTKSSSLCAAKTRRASPAGAGSSSITGRLNPSYHPKKSHLHFGDLKMAANPTTSKEFQLSLRVRIERILDRKRVVIFIL